MIMQKKLWRVLVYHENGEYWVEVPSMPGCFARAESLPAAMQSIHQQLQDECRTHEYPCEAPPY